MANGTIIQSGSFTADGNNKTLQLRSGIDKLVIENITQWAASNNGYGFKYIWYNGMGTTGMMEYHPAGDHTSAVNTVAGAFTSIDTSNYALGAPVSVTAGTNATQPEYSTGTTTGLTTGTIVRLYGTDQDNINGLDFSIDNVVGGTSFRLANTLATAPGITAGASGYYRIVAPNNTVYSMFYPGERHVADISVASSAVVTTLVDHGYTVGQAVKFNVPHSDFGMTEIDGLTGIITAVSTSTFTVNIDSSGFSAFKFPTYSLYPFRSCTVFPAGSGSTSTYVDTTHSFNNQGYIGIVLTGGTTGPGGNSGDTVYWTAYKSESVNNE